MPPPLTIAFLAAAATLSVIGCRGGEETKDEPASRSVAAPPAARAPATSPDGGNAAARSFYADRFSRRPSPAAMTDLGRALFFDRSLSASGQMSCATCHDPAFAYGPPND